MTLIIQTDNINGKYQVLQREDILNKCHNKIKILNVYPNNEINNLLIAVNFLNINVSHIEKENIKTITNLILLETKLKILIQALISVNKDKYSEEIKEIFSIITNTRNKIDLFINVFHLDKNKINKISIKNKNKIKQDIINNIKNQNI